MHAKDCLSQALGMSLWGCNAYQNSLLNAHTPNGALFKID